MAAAQHNNSKIKDDGFNTQPPEGGCIANNKDLVTNLGFNTQPPEGGCQRLEEHNKKGVVSTHSHPKVAAAHCLASAACELFQHTATRRWLLDVEGGDYQVIEFQHTATRRWLLPT